MNYIKQCYQKFVIDNKPDYMYRNHASQFVNYIENIEHLEDRIVDIHSIHLKNSVLYYNKEEVIGTATTLENYLNALKSFFIYLKKVGMAENIFNEIADYNAFKEEIKRECILNPTIQRSYLDKDVVKLLCDYFNDVKSKHKNMKMMEFFFKITLLAPAKRNVIANLKISDFSERFKTVTVNDVIVKLPRALSNSICDALQEAKYSPKNDDLFFALFFSGASYNDNVFNTPFYYALREIGCISSKKKPSASVESIQNTGIVSLAEKGASLQIISHISGLNKSSILDKLENFGIKNYEDDDEIISELYNSEIVKVDYYQDL